MCGSIVDIPATENRGGKEEERNLEKKKIETTAVKYNGLPYWAALVSWVIFVTHGV